MSLKKIRTFINNLLIPKFGNTLGVPLNLKWYLFEIYCRFNYLKKNAKSQVENKNEFKENKLCKLMVLDVNILRLKVQDYFKLLNSNASHTDMNQDSQSELASIIFDILKQSESKIATILGNYFQPYWIVIQESKPGIELVESSDSWHIDDNPKQMNKIFIYLNDVYSTNGAFRAFPNKISKYFLQKGFKSNNPETRRNNQNMINEFYKQNPDKLKILEGDSGTVLLFDNNLIHKGTLPIKNYRHVIQVLVYPSVSTLEIESVKAALLSPRKWDYPENPYLNDFGGLHIQ